MALLTYEYRLYPRHVEIKRLEALLTQARRVYNFALEVCKNTYQARGKGINAISLWQYFRDWRNQLPDDECLINASSLQHVLRRVDKAYAAFFGRIKAGETPGYPRFKGWDRFNSVEPNGMPAVGGDVGLLRLLTLSDGTYIDNPRWLRGSLAHLRRAQRRLSRRKKGSQRRRKARHQVALLHEHIANTRRDFWHKATYWLVKTYGAIALEDLSPQFMIANRHLSLSASDASIGLFQQLLTSKAANAGCELFWVAPAYTSQQCSGCGELVPKALSVRVHDCPHCGLVLDRDENAARNIYQRAFKSAWSEPSGGNVGCG